MPRTTACCASATRTSVAARPAKLREEEPGGATLIAYERPDAAAERVSNYRLVPVAGARRRCATRSPPPSGIAVVVVKRRHLLLWETVRIHLDEVRGLGSFLELEAVAEPGSDLRARAGAQVASCASCSTSATRRCARAPTPTR